MAEERPSLQEYAALLSPFGQASEFLVEAEFKVRWRGEEFISLISLFFSFTFCDSSRRPVML